MLSFPHAKINLGLRITRKRPDGFHDLETCFFPVPEIFDALEMCPSREPSLDTLCGTGYKSFGTGHHRG